MIRNNNKLNTQTSGMTSVLLLAVLMAGLLVCKNVAAESAGFSPYVDQSGKIRLPEDFRNTMSHLGTWYVPEGDASGFHDVYTAPESVRSYRKTGKFPDGTILVKELRAASTADYTTGKNVSFANQTIKQWFVMVKDSQNRFPGNRNWGEGWGWALFKPDNPAVNVSKDFQKDCLGCHTPAKKTDWVYIEAYPALSR